MPCQISKVFEKGEKIRVYTVLDMVKAKIMP